MLKSKIFVGSLVGATAFSAIILSSSTVSAETYTKSALIRVQAACTMDGTVTTAHSATIAGGTYREGIGESIVSITCNDAGGFGVYAIGFTGDTEGNNVLAHGTEDVSIATGTATSGNTSNWAMKLEAYENGNNTPTIENGYGSYKAVPDDYTLVASYPNATSATDDVVFKTYYSAYIAMTQRAGTYAGKVKYVMVHPSTGPAPERTGSFNSVFGAAGKMKVTVNNKQYYKLQDMTSFICNSVVQGEVTELVDLRDNTIYHVGKLADNRCWMLDNLALDLLDATVQANTNSSNTNANVESLDALFGVSNRTGQEGNLSATGVKDWTDYLYTSFSMPSVKTSDKEVVPSDLISTAGGYKVGVYYNYCAASAGSYCYGTNNNVPGNPVDRPNTAIDAEYDICPANWRLPTGNSYDATDRPDGGELQNLYDSYNSLDEYRVAFRLPFSGIYRPDLMSDKGKKADLWSSTFKDNDEMSTFSFITFGTNVIVESYTSYRYNGHSIRCVAR